MCLKKKENPYRKFLFREPCQTDFTFLYKDNSWAFSSIVPANRNYNVIDPSVKLFTLNCFVWYCFLKNIARFTALERWPNKSALKSLVLKCCAAYIAALLDVKKPKAVITFVDNGSFFSWLAKHHRRHLYIAIQNGMRICALEKNIPPLFADHYFCFGLAQFQQKCDFFSGRVGKRHPVGSLSASLNWPKSDFEGKKNYDILIVSCWRGNINSSAARVGETMRAMRKIDEWLCRYLQKNELNVAILLRSERGGKDWYMSAVGATEEEYYLNIYGRDLVDIIDTSSETNHVFSLIQKSELVFSLLSTAVIEACGKERKALFINGFANDEFYQSIPRQLVIKLSSFESFELRINELIKCSAKEFVKKNGDIIKKIMEFPDNRSTESVIRQKLEHIETQHER